MIGIYIMKVYKLLFLLLLCSIQGIVGKVVAQTNYTVAESLNIVEIGTVPFDGGKKMRIPYESCRTTRSEIPDLLYDDVAGTLSFHAEPEQAPYIHRRIYFPNGKILILVFVGGVTPYRADYACVTDTSGKVLDTLCVIRGGEMAVVRQFTINSNYELTTYSVMPVDGKVIMLPTLKSFEGQRVDTTYKIDDNGKFVKTAEVKYKPRTYTSAELEPWSKKDIRYGGETRVN